VQQAWQAAPAPTRLRLASQGYLEVKRDRMAHMLPDESPGVSADESAAGAAGESGELNGQFCFVDHEGEPTMVRDGRCGAAGWLLPARGRVHECVGPWGQLMVGGGQVVQGGADLGVCVLQAVSTAIANGGMDLPKGLAHGDNGRVVPAAAAGPAA
jgi:hypothetical protein